MERAEIERRVGAARIVPVLRLPDATAARRAAADCFAAGLDVVELTATTTGWQDAVAALRDDHANRVIGVGTVLDAGTAREALRLGADFVVSPCPAPAVRRAAADAVFIEGGMTVAELLDAGRRGLAKLFPAHVGGPRYLRSLLAVAPGLRVIPTGGIKLAEVDDWLQAGAFAVGVGTDLLSSSDQADRASALRAAVTSVSGTEAAQIEE